MAALAAATVGLFTSCSEEEIVKVSAKTGEAIRFSATTRAAATRTVYSATATDGKWDLYWVNDDQVTVHCPQANVQEGHVNTAVYTVTGEDGTHNVYGITGEGLYWGQEDKHYFYEAYPAKNVQQIENSVLTATMPVTQYAKLHNGCYVDMDAALMAGMTDCKKSSVESTGVDLPFEPIFTAVDITISPAPNQDFVLRSVTVANVEGEEHPAPVAGTFTYDMATEEYGDVAVENNVQLEFEEPITLTPGSAPVKATVFIRGDYNKAVKVVLNGLLDGELTNMKKQGDPEVSAHLLKPRMRNHIVMGALPEKKEQAPDHDLNGEWWISYEKNATPVSKMSLPGSYDSGNFAEGTNGGNRTQTKSFTELLKKYNNDKWAVPGDEVIKYQLNHGVRVFDFKLQWNNDDKKFFMNRNDTRDIPVDFENFLKYSVTWLQQHTTEFLVVFTRPLVKNGLFTGSENRQNENGYKQNIASEIDRIMSGKEAYYLKSFSPDITVAQARGKILFIEVNYAGDDYTGNTIDTWKQDVSGYQASNFKVTSEGSKVYIQDNFNVSNNTKLAEITNSFTICRKDNAASHWYITCSCHDPGHVANNQKTVNQRVIEEVAKCQSGQSLGIVLMGYVCTDDANQKGQTAVNAVWNLNFK